MEKNHKLNSIIASVNYGKTEGFNRPNHPDFLTTSELKSSGFTGLRKHEMARDWEFWIIGEIKKRVTFTELINNPKALEDAHIELFGMHSRKT